MKSTSQQALEISDAHINHLKENKVIDLNIRLSGVDYFVNLKKVELFNNNFSVIKQLDDSQSEYNYKKIYHYKGLLNGSNDFPIYLTLSDDKIIGSFTINGDLYNINFKDNLNSHQLNKLAKEENINPFSCHQIGESSKLDLLQLKNQKSAWGCNEEVNIYYECDYDMYLSFNSNIDSIIAYMSQLFLEVKTIYALEGIPLNISELLVWTTNDPYADNALGIYDFADSLLLNGFNGDLAQLITNDPGNNGGTAYVDQLCGPLPFGYCDINNGANPYPTYSWDVTVLAHELGHSFGSQHTHDCIWGPNGDQQIDDCGNISDPNSCYDSNNPILPIEGGTIMSYCHDQTIGINLLNGFGIEPGNLLRYKYQDCKCNNSNCTTALEIDTSDQYYAEPDSGDGASTQNARHADWFKFTPDSDGLLTIGSCGEGFDTRVWLWKGTCENLEFVAISDDDCSSGGNANYASEIVSQQLIANTDYFIEWDNRWSSSGFDWTLDFSPTISCDGVIISIQESISDTILHAEQQLLMSSEILPSSQIILKSGQFIELRPGFEINNGSLLELSIDQCDN